MLSNESPLVSCIMPTRDRRGFAQSALRYFEGQDYPNRELIVVDPPLNCGEDVVFLRGLTRRSTRICRLPDDTLLLWKFHG